MHNVMHMEEYVHVHKAHGTRAADAGDASLNLSHYIHSPLSAFIDGAFLWSEPILKNSHRWINHLLDHRKTSKETSPSSS